MRLHKREARAEERDILAAQPEQDDAMGICLQAWRDLHTERPLGFAGFGPIPRSAVRDWCNDEGLDRGVFRVLWAVICRLERDRNEREASAAALRGA